MIYDVFVFAISGKLLMIYLLDILVDEDRTCKLNIKWCPTLGQNFLLLFANVFIVVSANIIIIINQLNSTEFEVRLHSYREVHHPPPPHKLNLYTQNWEELTTVQLARRDSLYKCTVTHRPV